MDKPGPSASGGVIETSDEIKGVPVYGGLSCSGPALARDCTAEITMAGVTRLLWKKPGHRISQCRAFSAEDSDGQDQRPGGERPQHDRCGCEGGFSSASSTAASLKTVSALRTEVTSSCQRRGRPLGREVSSTVSKRKTGIDEGVSRDRLSARFGRTILPLSNGVVAVIVSADAARCGAHKSSAGSQSQIRIDNLRRE